MACNHFGLGVSFLLITINCLIVLAFRNDATPSLIFSNDRNLIIWDTDTKNTSVIADGYSNAYNINYHKEKNLIYWIDANTIFRIKYPPKTEIPAEDIQNGGGYIGLAVDPIHDHLYWTDKGIFRSNLDGSNVTLILDIVSDNDHAGYIDLDIKNRWIYFTNYGIKVEKCSFDGTERQLIVGKLSYVMTIDLDLDEGRIYWVEYLMDSIRSAQLDGSDIRTDYNNSLLRGLVYGMDTTLTHIYFTIVDREDRGLYSISKYDGTVDISLLYPNINIYSLKAYEQKSGPCYQYSVIQNEEKRSPVYVTDQSVDDIISDDRLDNNWYRIISENGDEMPNYPPGLYHCGTINPIWLNGSLPTIEGENVTQEACLQTVNNTCKEKIETQIINCGNRFYVYRLQNTTRNSGYCFGSGPVRCPDGLSSESGFFPGCSASFPNVTVLPLVISILIEGPVYNIPNYDPTPSLISVFKCSFRNTTGDLYVYDIYWYINGNSVKIIKNVPHDDINGVLKDSDWTDHYHMNMDVTCAVRIRASVGSLPSPIYESQVFKAGVYPEKYDYTVIEGDHVNIQFTSTVPVGCIGSHTDLLYNCYQNFYIYQPNYNKDEPINCHNNIVERDIVFRTDICGIRVGNLDWKEKKQLQVYGFSDGLYNSQDRSTVIKFSTTPLSSVNQIWNNFTTPGIKVTVIDRDSSLTGRLCQSYNDPHITTFDGRLYHYMDVGEYVIYKNDRGPYWVHALFTNCVSGWVGASCHCGIAIRSRQSLFVFRTCEKISRKEVYMLKQPLTEVRTCVDSDLSVETSGNTYTVTLSIGTEIKCTVASYSSFITMISVKPSIYDVKDARGLCGVPSVTKDPSDDFYHRDKGPISDDQEFARSWKILQTISPNEQLFIPDPHFLTEDSNPEIENDNQNANLSAGMYCVCEKQAEPNDEDFYTSQCSLSDSTEYCSSGTQSGPGNSIPSNPVVTTCTSNMQNRSLSLRTRRSVTDNDDIVLDTIPLEYDDDVNDNVTEPDYTDEWTEEKANLTCTDRIMKAIPSDLPDVPGLTDIDYIKSCMLDIKNTGGTTFVEDTIGALQTKAIMELSRNQTLMITKTDNNGSQSILDYVKGLLCPNNCSGNGTCTSGVCLCNEGYNGDDCLEESSKPPLNIEIPANGLCGIIERECRRTNVYGIFNAKTVWCRRRHFQILKGSHVVMSDQDTIQADYRNRYMVSVDLQSARRKRSVSGDVLAEGFELSFSNDEKEFGGIVNVVIYNEQCFTCNATSKECYPVVSCPVTTTELPETIIENLKDDSSTKYVIVGTSAVVLLLAIIFIIVCLKFRKFKSRKLKRMDRKNNTPADEMRNIYRGNGRKQEKMNVGIKY